MSRWWVTAVVVTGTLAVAATVVAVLSADPWWAALAVVVLAMTALLVAAGLRQPRRVAASASGVRVSSRLRDRDVAWDRVRRVRRPQTLGVDRPDAYVELDTGELVQLPRRTPGGVVEGWRERHRGDRPAAGLPQTWRLTPEEMAQQSWLSRNLGVFVAVMGVNLVNVFDLPVPAALVGFGLMVGLVALVTSRLPSSAITVDADGMTLPRPFRRHEHLPWSQVQDVRSKGRYEPGVVVELTTGGARTVLGPDVDVVREWRELRS
ncbi:PH domain-containing protein [Aquipuribacter hungaricus]|uniref:PH domain-containing protein n=1 Tax=Aquipuribacter hungaricus TaxID=545624 RepID=UPI003618829D